MFIVEVCVCVCILYTCTADSLIIAFPKAILLPAYSKAQSNAACDMPNACDAIPILARSMQFNCFNKHNH